MTLLDRQAIFARNVSTLIIYIFSLGLKCSLGEVYRTPEQAEIYFKEGKGIKNSLHTQRLAIDINLFDKSGVYLTDKKAYEAAGIFWKSLHPDNGWGGDFKAGPKGGVGTDAGHFQMDSK